MCVSLLLLSCGVCVVGGYPFRPPLDLDVTARTTVLTSDLQGCRRFQWSTVVNYSTLLLEDHRGLLYVGARGAAFALNATDISANTSTTIAWEASSEQKQQCLNKGKDNQTECFNHIRLLQRFNSTHLYMCGTHAFRPLCAYIEEAGFQMSSVVEDGREKCPYDPATGYTGLIIDQQMYTASQYEFRSFPDIRRNSPSPTVRTEDAPTRWLHEADFVGSALVRESEDSATGDDDKIYFFFTENSQEPTAAHTHSRVARVAQVCKGDKGGLLTLQKRWTSFLKARLVCSLPEYDFYFNVLRSVFVLPGATPGATPGDTPGATPGATPGDTLVYGVFGLEWRDVKASAVCRFSLSEVQQVFQGPFMSSQDSASQWSEYSGKVPEPRPGTCITDHLRARGINASTSLPDDVLNFVRRHPLMSQQVRARDRRPLLLRRTTDYTRMAVHRVEGLDGELYHVLYMGTDDGWLHKAVEVEGGLHIIEELQLFDQSQPVDSIVISPAQRSVYLGSSSGVVQLPLAACSRYSSCYDCVFARDPSCAWDGTECVDVHTHRDRPGLTQDVLQGNRGCENRTGDDLVPHRRRTVMEGDDVLLQCEFVSNLATPVWTLEGTELPGYGLDSGYRVGTDGLLIIEARPDQGGLYACHALENAVRVAVVAYDVTVRPDLPPPPPPPVAPTEEEDLALGPNVTRPPSPEPPSFSSSYGGPPPPPPAPPGPASLPPRSELLSPRNMEAMYLSLITVLGGLCVVLTVVLLYMGFCLRAHGGKYSLRAAAAARPAGKRPRSRKQHQRRGSPSRLELGTVSGRCNGAAGKRPGADAGDLRIVPGEGGGGLWRPPTGEDPHPPPPAAPPLPSPALLAAPECELGGHGAGLSATLPSVLRRMNGNSYVLLRQSDAEAAAHHCYSFADELNRILEKRKRAHLLPRPDESSV